MSLRDLLLSALLIGGLPVALMRPFVGVVFFAWLGMMNPHRMTWGFAYDVSWAQMYAIATMIGLVVNKDRAIADSFWRYRFTLAYLAWMCITTVFAIEGGRAFEKLIEIVKVQTMCLITLFVLTSRARVEMLAAVSAMSIAFFGIKGGVFTVLHGGEHRVWGPPDSIITDNNHLAVGLAMTVPLVYWLFRRAERNWQKVALVAAMLLMAVSILGSYSRSAFIGLCAMAVFLVLKSDRKMLIIPIVAVGVVAALGLMPGKYWERIESIGTYQEDDSATGRINTWKTSINVANDRITGGGFEYYGPTAFALYSPEPQRIHSSHSIYFQALGEHGWIGLALFLSIWIFTWWSCSRARAGLPDTREGRSLDLLLRMIQVSLIGFAVGGAFVNIGNWDFVYYESLIALAIRRLVDRQLLASAEQQGEAPAGPAVLSSGRSASIYRPTSLGRSRLPQAPR